LLLYKCLFDVCLAIHKNRDVKNRNSAPPTILFISHEASRTGAPIFLLRFLRWFQEQDRTPFHILLASHGPLAAEFAALGPTDCFEPELTFGYRALRKLGMDGAARSKHLRALREKLLASNIGLIYSNTFVNGRILEFLSFLDCPVLCHVHELEGPIRLFGAENEALVKKYASQYIAVSEAVRSNLVAGRGIPGGRVNVIHGFIPVTAEVDAVAADSRAAVRRELKISQESLVVCGCGSIEARKGIDLFLGTAKRVKERMAGGSVHFIWVGGGPEQARQAEKQAREMGLGDTVHFLGAKADVAKYYAASEIFFLSSREEPLGLVMLEAALQGLPVVCFQESGGAPEFVEEDAGCVVPGLDVEKMAEAIVELLSDGELRRRLGAAGRQKVKDRHELGYGSAKIRQIIQQMLASE
jgi:glycosyltransferase involved in cell wall biosynthesis